MSQPSKVLVTLQFICILYFVFFTNMLCHGALFILQLLGFALSLYAVIVMRPGRFNIQPEVKKEAVFIQSGPYRLIRNPMYTGLILIFACVVVQDPDVTTFLVFSSLVVVLLFKVHLEERYLSQHFGEPYLQYMRKTKRLLPFIY